MYAPNRIDVGEVQARQMRDDEAERRRQQRLRLAAARRDLEARHLALNESPEAVAAKHADMERLKGSIADMGATTATAPAAPPAATPVTPSIAPSPGSSAVGWDPSATSDRTPAEQKNAPVVAPPTQSPQMSGAQQRAATAIANAGLAGRDASTATIAGTNPDGSPMRYWGNGQYGDVDPSGVQPGEARQLVADIASRPADTRMNPQLQAQSNLANDPVYAGRERDLGDYYDRRDVVDESTRTGQSPEAIMRSRAVQAAKADLAAFRAGQEEKRSADAAKADAAEKDQLAESSARAAEFAKTPTPEGHAADPEDLKRRIAALHSRVDEDRAAAKDVGDQRLAEATTAGSTREVEHRRNVETSAAASAKGSASANAANLALAERRQAETEKLRREMQNPDQKLTDRQKGRLAFIQDQIKGGLGDYDALIAEGNDILGVPNRVPMLRWGSVDTSIPDFAKLVKGRRYQTPKGDGVWDGQGFDDGSGQPISIEDAFGLPKQGHSGNGAAGDSAPGISLSDVDEYAARNGMTREQVLAEMKAKGINVGS